MLNIRKEVKNGYRYSIGTECEWSFWHDTWLMGYAVADFLSKEEIAETGINAKAKVNEVWNRGRWNLPYSNEVNVRNLWLSIKDVNMNMQSNTITWANTPNGEYTIKSGWNKLRHKKNKVRWASFVWGKGCLPRHSFIVWLAIKSRLPVRSRLRKWGMVEVDSCPMCGTEEESIKHLFFECSFGKQVWREIAPKVDINRDPYVWRKEISWLSRHACGKSKLAMLRRTSVAAMIYHIWLEKNKVVFCQDIPSYERVTKSVVSSIFFNSLYSYRTLAECFEGSWL